MRFGEVRVDEAVGAILAHSVSVGGLTLKKGRVLTADDVGALQAAGRQHVFAARMTPSDVGEDAAAAALAAALRGTNVRAAAPFTGRANLYATSPGVFAFDPAVVAAVNGVDESMTLATLAPSERVAAGQMVATVKIIPFAVDRAHLARAVEAAGTATLRVDAFRALRVGVLVTALPGTKPAVLAKRRDAIETRVTALGGAVIRHSEAAHSIDAVAHELRALAADPAIDTLTVFAASAIVDRADVIPAGLVAAGGDIIRLGMPVDPGNLLLLGSLAGRTMIGVPSCAASPKLNGFDWVLERLAAGQRVDGPAIAAMGVGGLLKEIATRPQPREGAPTAVRTAPQVAAVILAAGRSTRMGRNKLLELLEGRPILRHVVEAAQGSSVATTAVVVGHQAEQVRAAVAGAAVQVVECPHYAEGLSASLKAGLAALPNDIDAAIVLLGDMPDITAAHIDQLIAAFSPDDGRTIVVPTHAGKRGNPVLWGRAHFVAMIAESSGDTGAKHLIGRHADEVVEVDLGTDAIFLDVDTPEALAAVTSRAASHRP